jgi:hypothetical protein
MIDTTVRRAVGARLKTHRFSRRTRRARTLGAAGFAGVSVALLASEIPAPTARPAETPNLRFAANTLVDGMVAVPVRFADAGSAAFLRPGDRIDVLSTTDTGTAAGAVPDALIGRFPEEPRQGIHAAVDVTVLATPTPGDSPRGPGMSTGTPSRETSTEGGLVILAVDNATSADLARDAATGRLSYALHPARPSPG